MITYETKRNMHRTSCSTCNSAYDEKDKIRVYRKAVMKPGDTCPGYRDKDWNRMHRVCDKANRVNAGYKAVKYQEVVFVEAVAHE